MSTTFEFEEEGDHEFQETAFLETEWEAEYGRRRGRPRMARRFPTRPFRPIKRPFPFRPRRPAGMPYVPVFPVIPWTAAPLDEPPAAPSNSRPLGGAASPPFAEPAVDAPWSGDTPAQDAPADSPPVPDAISSDEPPPAEPANSDQPQGESSRVRWSQDALNRALGLELEISGLLNAPTRSAIRMLQRQEGLSSHGRLDRATASALRRRSLLTADGGSMTRPSCGCAGPKHTGCGCASCRKQAGL